jgi:diacylglycerol kinase (ATP)
VTRNQDDIVGKPGNTGIMRVVRATRYSAQGLAAAWRHEAAFRQELALTIVLAPAAIWLGRSALERTMLIGVCIVVLIIELLNSAIEAAIDRHGEEQHVLSGRAKDLGSAAVLLGLTLVVMVWGAVIWQRFGA